MRKVVFLVFRSAGLSSTVQLELKNLRPWKSFGGKKDERSPFEDDE